MANFVQKSLGQAILEANLKNQYMNEYVTEKDYRKLSESERLDNFTEYALNEFVNTTAIIDAVFNGKGSAEEQFGKTENGLKTNKYFKDIDSSLGDITRTKDNTNLKALLNYAVAANYQLKLSGVGIEKFNNYALEILKCIDNFERSKARFKSIITKESTRVNSKRIGAGFYRTAVFLVQMTGDLLYSTSLRAKFNYNIKPPAVEGTHFDCDTDHLDDMMSFIQYLNSAFSNGRIFSALEDTLQEALEHASVKVSLQEGVIDTIFGLVNYFKSLDLLLLWPIYITRAITYWVMYLYTNVNNITLDIDASIAIQRSTNLSKDQYDDYVANANIKSAKVTQAFSKASVALEASAKEDRKSLERLQSGNVMI